MKEPSTEEYYKAQYQAATEELELLKGQLEERKKEIVLADRVREAQAGFLLEKEKQLKKLKKQLKELTNKE